MITCSRCSLSKEEEKFPKNKANKSGRRGVCKECVASRQREYYKKNPDQAQKHRDREKLRSRSVPAWRRHGLTDEQYEILKNRYDGRCWACKSRPVYVVDHDHSCCNKARSCGKCVRGLLCSQCNTAQGLLMDDVDVIQGLLEYMMGGASVSVKWKFN